MGGDHRLTANLLKHKLHKPFGGGRGGPPPGGGRPGLTWVRELGIKDPNTQETKWYDEWSDGSFTEQEKVSTQNTTGVLLTGFLAALAKQYVTSAALRSALMSTAARVAAWTTASIIQLGRFAQYFRFLKFARVPVPHLVFASLVLLVLEASASAMTPKQNNYAQKLKSLQTQYQNEKLPGPKAEKLLEFYQHLFAMQLATDAAMDIMIDEAGKKYCVEPKTKLDLLQRTINAVKSYRSMIQNSTVTFSGLEREYASLIQLIHAYYGKNKTGANLVINTLHMSHRDLNQQVKQWYARRGGIQADTASVQNYLAYSRFK